MCIYFNKRNMLLFGLNRNILLDKHIWKNTFIFSGNAIIIYKMQTEQRNWVYVKNNFLHSTNKSLF